MLYKLIQILQTDISLLNVFRYITFRTIVSALMSLTAILFLGRWGIERLRSLQVGQYIREDGPPNHKDKAGTPTMGGCLILPVITLVTVFWAEPKNYYVWLVIAVALGFGTIGFVDDYLKRVRKNSKGLRAKSKFGLQFIVALTVTLMIFFRPEFDSRLMVPFFKNIRPDFGIWYIPFAVFIIVGASNAVNLTDGLDGLAIGPIIVSFVAYLTFSYLTGHVKIADYLQIPYVTGAGELAIFCGAVVGAGLGFLWFNAYPAEVFMGDVGSLPLGAALGTVAVITKQELVLILVGGLFVVEALSVIFQVAWFRFSDGKRIFRMAPLHHHFELKGWPESKVTVRFWIISVILALLAVSTLKLR
jgi:phospho-N-acetylmuramoyl-pentapeptide-transferase